MCVIEPMLLTKEKEMRMTGGVVQRIDALRDDVLLTVAQFSLKNTLMSWVLKGPRLAADYFLA